MLDAQNSWCVGDLLAANCQNSVVPPTMEKFDVSCVFLWLQQTKMDKKERLEDEHHMVGWMVSSVQGGAGSCTESRNQQLGGEVGRCLMTWMKMLRP